MRNDVRIRRCISDLECYQNYLEPYSCFCWFCLSWDSVENWDLIQLTRRLRLSRLQTNVQVYVHCLEKGSLLSRAFGSIQTNFASATRRSRLETAFHHCSSLVTINSRLLNYFVEQGKCTNSQSCLFLKMKAIFSTRNIIHFIQYSLSFSRFILVTIPLTWLLDSTEIKHVYLVLIIDEIQVVIGCLIQVKDIWTRII